MSSGESNPRPPVVAAAPAAGGAPNDANTQNAVDQRSTTATNNNNTTTDRTTLPPTDEFVLKYLRARGLGSAAIELERRLKEHPTSRERMELEDAEASNQKNTLMRSTGGGYGYDADAAVNIPAWGLPTVSRRPQEQQQPQKDDDNDDEHKTDLEVVGNVEARGYVESFTALQLWVLSLPEDPAGLQPSPNSRSSKIPEISIASIAHRAAGNAAAVPEQVWRDAESIRNSRKEAPSWMPPSTKPELLGVTFALFVHTYCDLLEFGVESTAESLLETFRAIYDPIYQNEMADLDKTKTTQSILRLNQMNHAHMDSLHSLRTTMYQAAQTEAKRDDLSRDPSLSTDPAKQRKLSDYERHITLLRTKYDQLSKRATQSFDRMQGTPFLRRARAVRWQLHLSSMTYAMLAAFLSSRDDLLPMSTLLQIKCEIHVERRDPLPYTPACVLDDQTLRNNKRALEEVNWAAPVPPAARVAETGEPVDHPAKLKQTEKLPFPPLHLDEEYNSKEEGAKAKRAVEFNRALLVNGFRRLEALERKQEYEVGQQSSKDDKKGDQVKSSPAIANALKPTILLSTLCSSASVGPVLDSKSTRFGSIDASAIWEESGIGITCGKMCPPDGRRVAAGCTDAAVRIWSLVPSKGGDKKKSVSETDMVLLGHKNGFPVFDVNWNRDGRSLLSAGGDGSIRLWDTMAKGPFGTVTEAKRHSAPARTAKEEDGPMSVPGLRAEASDDLSGAALTVYRGHAPSCPVWSVEFAPSGYYFASAAADATGRIWTTDRPSPVRVLTGHTSASVNTITWHPNCNYVLTGCDDKTVRMWDIQNGRCVRLLSGCSNGINVVRVCPSGRYAAGADYGGVVHIWDLGTGKKVNELRNYPQVGDKRNALDQLAASASSSSSMIHSMSYSACGTALATGGDDCVVRVWDVRGVGGKAATGEERPGTRRPCKSFATRDTMILNLQYTKRNLLLALGKYTTAVPLATPITN